MMQWLKRLFGVLDRGNAASERIALALEGMAADLEAARAMLRDRVGLEEQPVAALPGSEEPTRRNGRKEKVA
jgi:hypothetical protein